MQVEGCVEEVCHESFEKVEMLKSRDIETVAECGGCSKDMLKKTGLWMLVVIVGPEVLLIPSVRHKLSGGRKQVVG